MLSQIGLPEVVFFPDSFLKRFILSDSQMSFTMVVVWPKAETQPRHQISARIFCLQICARKHRKIMTIYKAAHKLCFLLIFFS